MHIKVRTMDGLRDTSINLSRLTTVADVKQLIQERMSIDPLLQRLYYKGKRLEDTYKLFDYSVKINEVIQLCVLSSIPTETASPVATPTVSAETEQPVAADVDKFQNYEKCERNDLYEVGEPVEVREEGAEQGAWIEAKLVKILKARDNNDFVYFISYDDDDSATSEMCEVSERNFRPRSWRPIAWDDVKVGMTALVNYNVEDARHRGYWYDMLVTGTQSKRSRRTMSGTLYLGVDAVPLQDVTVDFAFGAFALEPRGSSKKRERPSAAIPPRRCAPLCRACDDDASRDCKHCGCNVCHGKHAPETQVMCDECDAPFHVSCLTPALMEVPEGDWYCSRCKNDADIVVAGAALKHSKRRAKMPSAQPGPGAPDPGTPVPSLSSSKTAPQTPEKATLGSFYEPSYAYWSDCDSEAPTDSFKGFETPKRSSKNPKCNLMGFGTPECGPKTPNASFKGFETPEHDSKIPKCGLKGFGTPECSFEDSKGSSNAAKVSTARLRKKACVRCINDGRECRECKCRKAKESAEAEGEISEEPAALLKAELGNKSKAKKIRKAEKARKTFVPSKKLLQFLRRLDREDLKRELVESAAVDNVLAGHEKKAKKAGKWTAAVSKEKPTNKRKCVVLDEFSRERDRAVLEPAAGSARCRVKRKASALDNNGDKDHTRPLTKRAKMSPRQAKESQELTEIGQIRAEMIQKSPKISPKHAEMSAQDLGTEMERIFGTRGKVSRWLAAKCPSCYSDVSEPADFVELRHDLHLDAFGDMSCCDERASLEDWLALGAEAKDFMVRADGLKDGAVSQGVETAAVTAGNPTRKNVSRHLIEDCEPIKKVVDSCGFGKPPVMKRKFSEIISEEAFLAVMPIDGNKENVPPVMKVVAVQVPMEESEGEGSEEDWIGTPVKGPVSPIIRTNKIPPPVSEELREKLVGRVLINADSKNSKAKAQSLRGLEGSSLQTPKNVCCQQSSEKGISLPIISPDLPAKSGEKTNDVKIMNIRQKLKKNIVAAGKIRLALPNNQEKTVWRAKKSPPVRIYSSVETVDAVIDGVVSGCISESQMITQGKDFSAENEVMELENAGAKYNSLINAIIDQTSESDAESEKISRGKNAHAKKAHESREPENDKAVNNSVIKVKTANKSVFDSKIEKIAQGNNVVAGNCKENKEPENETKTVSGFLKWLSGELESMADGTARIHGAVEEKKNAIPDRDLRGLMRTVSGELYFTTEQAYCLRDAVKFFWEKMNP